METPLRPGPVRFDLAGLENLRAHHESKQRLDPGSQPVEGAHVMLIAPIPRGEVETSGVVERVLSEQRMVVKLVFVSDESLRASFPMLVVMDRTDESAPWSIVVSEPQFSQAPKDPELEATRTKVVVEGLAHLLRRKRDAGANPFAAAMYEKDRAWVEAGIQEIQMWHRDTRRSWPLDESL